MTYELIDHSFDDRDCVVRAWVLDEELSREYQVEVNASNCTSGVIAARDVGPNGEVARDVSLTEIGDEKLAVEMWASRSGALAASFWGGVEEMQPRGSRRSARRASL